MRAWLLIAVVLLVGCDLAPSNAPDYSAGISLACGVAGALPDAPPEPEPDDDVCRSCGGTGWLGDGVIKTDCPDCDTPWRSTPPEVTTPQEVTSSATAGDGQSPAEPEAAVWYSSYDAAGKVALETGRPLIIAITEEKPDYQPTSDVAFCWLHLAEVGPEWDRFNPPCVLRCDRVTDSEPPKFTPITLEAL